MAEQLSVAALNFLQHVNSRVAARRDAKRQPEHESDDLALNERIFRQAAVQHVWSLADLVPEGEKISVQQRRSLLAHSYLAPGQYAAELRSLRRPVRLKYLAKIGTAEAALALLAKIPQRASTPTQVIFEQLLANTLPSLDSLSQSQLFLLDEVQLWASALALPPIDPHQLKSARMYAQAMSSFQHLLTETFVGRDEELRAFREILDIDDPSLSSRIGSMFRGGVPRLIYLEGVGGIGKTALMGHMLSQFRDEQKRSRFGFAYMACDDPGFEILRPEVMLQNAAGQIKNHMRLASRSQAIKSDKRFDQALEHFNKALRLSEKTRAFATKRSTAFASQESRLSSNREQHHVMWNAFAALADAASTSLDQAKHGKSVIVLIIDSFEEVQGLAESELRPFWDCLETILHASQSMRVVVAGRSPLDRRDLGVPSYHKQLDELGEDAAVDLLQQKTGGDTDTLSQIRRHIGGNPLNLRLAARVLNEGIENAKLITDISTRSYWFLKVGPEIIRGQLYQRVLDHIHDSDPRVRKLAHPGMVLRRVTPDIIKEVLAPLCNIEIVDSADAERLFSALQKEHTLVQVDDDGSLRYRQDLRRPVLDLLKADQSAIVPEVHAAAAAYYSGRSEPVSIAEYIYHRLMLGERPSLNVESMPELGKTIHRYLSTAMEEVPPQGKLYLASILGLKISDELRAAADDAEWEQIIGPRALQTLLSEGTEAALNMLHERQRRTPESPLLAIEARCYLSLELSAQAETFIQQALNRFPINGNPGRRAELTWLLAQARLQDGRREKGIETLTALADYARNLSTPVPRIQALAVLVDLLPIRDSRYTNVLNDLALALEQCECEPMYGEVEILRYGFARVSEEKSAKLANVALVALSGLFDLDDTQYRGTPEIIEGLAALGKDQIKLIDTLASRTDDKKTYGEITMLRNMANSMLHIAQSSKLQSVQDAYKLGAELRSALTRGTSGDSPLLRAACRGAWWLSQGATGSLTAATLAGLTAYREPWELSSAAEATI